MTSTTTAARAQTLAAGQAPNADAVAALIAPRREVRTYMLHGRQTYADTGRPVDENFGTHVVRRIVDDAEAFAAKIEADADAAVAQYPKCRIARQRQARDYETAVDVRARGPRESWYGSYHSAEAAARSVAEWYRAHTYPGVRYLADEIVEASACPACHCPTIRAAGQVRHATGGYPTECIRRPEPDPVEDEPRQDGEFEIGTGGYMVCGYCDQTERWPEAFAACLTLTGDHMLGVEKATGELVVLAEATTLTGQTTVLPHHCEKIPDEVRNTYAAAIAAAAEKHRG